MRFLFALAVLCFSVNSWAVNHILFVAPGVQAPDYDAQVQQLINSFHDGDTVQFSNQKQFKILSILGHGDSQLIMQIEGNKTIRIALKSGLTLWDKDHTDTYLNEMTNYVAAYDQLTPSDLPIPKVYEDESFVPEYIVTDAVNVVFVNGVKFSLRNWLGGMVTLPDDQAKKVWDALVEFGRLTWDFKTMGDFLSKQIVWDGTRWWLVDFDLGNNRAQAAGDPCPINLFPDLQKFPDIVARIDQAIQTERKIHFCADPMASLTPAK